jgi:hypothetical protein
MDDMVNWSGWCHVFPRSKLEPELDRLNLSGLLNVLDGVVDTPGRVVEARRNGHFKSRTSHPVVWMLTMQIAIALKKPNLDF